MICRGLLSGLSLTRFIFELTFCKRNNHDYRQVSQKLDYQINQYPPKNLMCPWNKRWSLYLVLVTRRTKKTTHKNDLGLGSVNFVIPRFSRPLPFFFKKKARSLISF